jgi:hypothetical protein
MGASRGCATSWKLHTLDRHKKKGPAAGATGPSKTSVSPRIENPTKPTVSQIIRFRAVNRPSEFAAYLAQGGVRTRDTVVRTPYSSALPARDQRCPIVAEIIRIYEDISSYIEGHKRALALAFAFVRRYSLFVGGGLEPSNETNLLAFCWSETGERKRSCNFSCLDEILESSSGTIYSSNTLRDRPNIVRPSRWLPLSQTSQTGQARTPPATNGGPSCMTKVV